MGGVVFDELWLEDYCRRTGKRILNTGGTLVLAQTQDTPTKPKRNKYGNVKTARYGRVFDSKHEADVCDELMILVRAGEINAFSMQVEFLLPGGVKYVADFVTMNLDGTYTVIDAKSEATRKDKTYRLKRRLMKECLGLEIDER